MIVSTSDLNNNFYKYLLNILTKIDYLKIKNIFIILKNKNPPKRLFVIDKPLVSF